MRLLYSLFLLPFKKQHRQTERRHGEPPFDWLKGQKYRPLVLEPLGLEDILVCFPYPACTSVKKYILLVYRLR